VDPAHLRPMPAIEAAIAAAANPIEVPRRASRRRRGRAREPEEHIDTIDACPLLSELLYDREAAGQMVPE
jgi:hypothetical protein